jgi:hypothetical protein
MVVKIMMNDDADADDSTSHDDDCHGSYDDDDRK